MREPKNVSEIIRKFEQLYGGDRKLGNLTEEEREVYEFAKSCLEKENPMAVGEHDGYHYCPNCLCVGCMYDALGNAMKYCGYCGQRLSNHEDEE